MSHLSLSLLGAPLIRLDDQPLTFRTRKALALLIYLAVAGAAHTREQITLLFWPDSDATRGRQMLRTTLAHLRQALGDNSGHLLLERDALSFNFNASHSLDLHTLDAAVRSVQSSAASRQSPVTRDPSSVTSHQPPVTNLQSSTFNLQPPFPNDHLLITALSFYRGDFLNGFTLNDAPDFDDWASQQREAYHQRFGLLCNQLSQRQSEQGALPQAIETATHWVCTIVSTKRRIVVSCNCIWHKATAPLPSVCLRAAARFCLMNSNSNHRPKRSRWPSASKTSDSGAMLLH